MSFTLVAVLIYFARVWLDLIRDLVRGRFGLAALLVIATLPAVLMAMPHEDGIVADACVTCPLHARRFDLRTGAQHGGDDVVAVHEVREDDGVLWVRVTG